MAPRALTDGSGVTRQALRVEAKRVQRATERGEVEAGVEAIIDAATRHGQESDPDHEVGDLQDALRLAWDLLIPAARKTLLRRYFETHGEE